MQRLDENRGKKKRSQECAIYDIRQKRWMCARVRVFVSQKSARSRKLQAIITLIAYARFVACFVQINFTFYLKHFYIQNTHMRLNVRRKIFCKR